MDPEDPTVIAENELLGAAAAIEAAAKKLEQLRPRIKPKVRGLFPPVSGLPMVHTSPVSLAQVARHIYPRLQEMVTLCVVPAC